MKKEKKGEERKRWSVTYIVDGRRTSPNGVPVDEDGYELPTPKRSPRPKVETLEIVPGHELDKADAEALYIPALRELIRKTFGGERAALESLRAVHGLLLPKPSVHVERAMEVCQLMLELSHVVMPSRVGSTTLLSGAVKLKTDAATKRTAIYKLAKKYWRPKTTLQSLAIKTFVRELPRSGQFEGISEETIRRDLHKLNKLAESAGDGRMKVEMALANGETLPYFFHTEAWKRTKQK